MTEYPENYTWLMSNFKEVMETHQGLGKELLNAGPISEKNAQLIQLAAAAASGSQGAVNSHIKRALKAGAQPEEIYHTLVLLISTIGFPATAAALSWGKRIIESKDT